MVYRQRYGIQAEVWYTGRGTIHMHSTHMIHRHSTQAQYTDGTQAQYTLHRHSTYYDTQALYTVHGHSTQAQYTSTVHKHSIQAQYMAQYMYVTQAQYSGTLVLCETTTNPVILRYFKAGSPSSMRVLHNGFLDMSAHFKVLTLCVCLQ